MVIDNASQRSPESPAETQTRDRAGVVVSAVDRLLGIRPEGLERRFGETAAQSLGHDRAESSLSGMALVNDMINRQPGSWNVVRGFFREGYRLSLTVDDRAEVAANFLRQAIEDHGETPGKRDERRMLRWELFAVAQPQLRAFLRDMRRDHNPDLDPNKYLHAESN